LIKLGESDIISEIIGLYAFFIGLIIFIVSKSARDTLIKLRDSISTDEELLIKFRKYDVDNSGYLDRSEISALCRDLGTPLSLNQLEVVILTMDKTPDGKISYEEFLEWWTEKNNDWA
jgi:Ca2+-binding EF-hand superfamily protein